MAISTSCLWLSSPSSGSIMVVQMVSLHLSYAIFIEYELMVAAHGM